MRPAQVHLVVWLTAAWVLSTASIVSRLAARRLTRIPCWWDDYLAAAAYLFAASYNAVMAQWKRDGFGLQGSEITWLTAEASLSKARRDLFFLEILYVLSLGSAKLAILALYWRMFSLTALRYPIVILAICAVAWVVVRAILGIVHCNPVDKYWDDTLQGSCSIDDAKLFVGAVSAHVVVDVFILILPVLELRKLSREWPTKLGIIFSFMIGVFTCVASFAIIIISTRLDAQSPELSYNLRTILIWSIVEVNLAIVSVCFPLLRPLLCRSSCCHARKHETRPGTSAYFDRTAGNKQKRTHRWSPCAHDGWLSSLLWRRPMMDSRSLLPSIPVTRTSGPQRQSATARGAAGSTRESARAGGRDGSVGGCEAAGVAK